MRRAAIIPLLLALLAQTGCMYSFDIPLREVRNLNSGTVTNSSGEKESVRKAYQMRPIPRDGFVFVPSEDGTLLQAYERDHPLAKRAGPLKELKGPVEMAAEGDTVVLRGPEGLYTLYPEWVKRVEVRQFSPGKTAGLATGLFFGTPPVATTITLIVLAATGNLHLDGDWSYGTGYGYPTQGKSRPR